MQETLLIVAVVLPVITLVLIALLLRSSPEGRFVELSEHLSAATDTTVNHRRIFAADALTGRDAHCHLRSFTSHRQPNRCRPQHIPICLRDLGEVVVLAGL